MRGGRLLLMRGGMWLLSRRVGLVVFSGKMAEE